MKRPAVLVPALLVISIAATLVAPHARHPGQMFAFGVQRGAEDQQSGIRYATDATAWKMMPKNGNWMPGEIALMQRLFAESPRVARRDTFVFMAGYRLASHAVLFRSLAAVFLMILLLWVFWRTGRRSVV